MAFEHALAYFQERGGDPNLLRTKEWLALTESLLVELETLRRIRHLALLYREAEIECSSSFEAEPRQRKHRRCVELDALLGIEQDWRGVA